ncbi:sel1 repeat family protein [Olsenella sp. KGMB02461]|nr:sel1 repeat family protein [Olsenella sp. KGMB02461]
MSEFDSISVEQLIKTAENCLEKNSEAYDPVKAADLLQKGANLGSMASLEKLGDCYFYGTGRDEDNRAAFEAYTKVFEATGNSYSAYQLGRMHTFGWGVESNPDKARDYLEKSWADGYAAAAGILGVICLDRAKLTHDEKDVEEGLKWLQRGSNQGDPYSIFRMALVFSIGDCGIREDKKRAYDLLMKVPDYPRALGYLLISNGLDICSNDQYSELLNRALDLAESTNKGMLFRSLGRVYEGNTRLPADPKKSEEYFMRALDAGDGYSGYILGNNYAYGWNGYQRDVDKAETIYLKGANLGSEEAMSSLGDLYKKRAEVVWPRDPEIMRLSFEWYEKAYKAGGGASDALHAGQAALEAQDPSLEERAAECFKVAMEDDIPWAYVPLAKLSIKEGTPTYCPKLARQALEKARAEETDDYMTGEVDYLIGFMFERGLGLPASANQAVESYIKASDKGCEEAKEALKGFRKGLFGWKRI